MKKFEESINNLRASLRELVNTDNAEALAKVDKIIDDAVVAYNATDEELREAKNTIVDYVKNTSFKTPPQDDIPDMESKSLDDIMLEELNKIK